MSALLGMFCVEFRPFLGAVLAREAIALGNLDFGDRAQPAGPGPFLPLDRLEEGDRLLPLGVQCRVFRIGGGRDGRTVIAIRAKPSVSHRNEWKRLQARPRRIS